MSEVRSWIDGAIQVNDRAGREAEAIAACRSGRVEGLEALYEIHRYPVFRTCLRILGERGAAEDATQEIFLKVFDRVSSFSARSAFATWLYRLAVNHCLNLVDSAKRHAAVPVDEARDAADPAGEPEEAYARRESEDRLVRVLGELSVEHRTVLTLREIEGLGYREIADVLEVPMGTVMSRLSRAREALKERLRAAAASGVMDRGGGSPRVPDDGVGRTEPGGRR